MYALAARITFATSLVPCAARIRGRGTSCRSALAAECSSLVVVVGGVVVREGWL